MKLRVGYELIYECPQPTPMILMLHIHHTRAPDIIVADLVTTNPTVPITAYRDGFGNWCSRLVAPRGQFQIASTAVLHRQRRAGSYQPGARQHPWRSCRMRSWCFCWAADIAKPIDCPRSPGNCSANPDRLGTRAGDLRLRPSPYRVRLRRRPVDQNGMGGVQ